MIEKYPQNGEMLSDGTTFLWIVGGLVLALSFYILARGFQKGDAADGLMELCFGSRSRAGRQSGYPQRPRGRRPTDDVLSDFPSYKTDHARTGDANQLPELCKKLVHDAHTHLAIPAQPLMDRAFEIDILSYDAAPLLTASMKRSEHGNFSREHEIWISLYGRSDPLAIVTEMQDILLPDGYRVGKLLRETGGKSGDLEFWTFRNSRDSPALLECVTDGQQLRLLSPTGGAGNGSEKARVTRREAGSMKAASSSSVSAPLVANVDHYELLAQPKVDAVLVTSIFLASHVFGGNASGPAM
jgi:hypothetical protein